MEEELLLLEQQVRRNNAEMVEEEFWQNELQIEHESERQLRQQLVELQGRVRDCEAELSEYSAHMQVSRWVHTRREKWNDFFFWEDYFHASYSI